MGAGVSTDFCVFEFEKHQCAVYHENGQSRLDDALCKHERVRTVVQELYQCHVVVRSFMDGLTEDV